MIIDTIKNLTRYNIRYAEKIITFINSNDCLTLPDEQIDIDGKNLFVRVQSYEPKNKEENKFESHIVHADVQYIARGKELMQVAKLEDLTPMMDFDREKDYRFYTIAPDADCNDLAIDTGDFALFLPGEAHRPCCKLGTATTTVKKLVFKIKMV